MAVKYFNTGFLALETKPIVKLTDISISYSVDVDETTSFDDDFVKTYEPQYAGWTATASGVLSDDTAEPVKYSGETRFSGSTAQNGFLLFELAKTRTPLAFVGKVDTSNYQVGTVIITSHELSGSVGSKMTYSINLQGSGALTKSAT